MKMPWYMKQVGCCTCAGGQLNATFRITKSGAWYLVARALFTRMVGFSMKNKLFHIVWRHRIGECTLVRVKGWRTCVLDSKHGQRSTNTFCLFPWD